METIFEKVIWFLVCLALLIAILTLIFGVNPLITTVIIAGLFLAALSQLIGR